MDYRRLAASAGVEQEATQKALAISNRLEFAERSDTMQVRLSHAVERIRSVEGGQAADSRHTLRNEQIGVFTDFAQFLGMAADDTVQREWPYPSGRIILPPRTGKTIIAGQIIAASGMVTTFIVPTKTLVAQTAKSLRQQLINVPVGEFFGEKKNLVMWGVNVTTYSILQAYYRKHSSLPIELAVSSLIFADEGHHSMTQVRQEILAKGFDRLAIRVALTATANYSRLRRLATYFRHLIHEISISEAIELELVAPVRVWIAEVDVDGSEVFLRGEDFDEQRLGEIMGGAPFFEAARLFRYSPEQQDKPCLMCCSTRQQAYDLQRYLAERLPPGKPEPAFILGDTPSSKREELLEDFESGSIDTLINVGVLIEGWNSLACKLLIDLAPSLSWVKATQKFFRPMTKDENREAAIFMLIPKGLPAMPIIPMDLFEWNMPEFEEGVLISSKEYAQTHARPIVQMRQTPIADVKAATKTVLQTTFEKPKLDPTRRKQVMAVLRTQPGINRHSIPLFSAFRKMVFHHRLFIGRGENLMRFCKFKLTRHDYVVFMAQYFPEAASDYFCRDRSLVPEGKKLADFPPMRFVRPDWTPSEEEDFKGASFVYLEDMRHGPPDLEHEFDQTEHADPFPTMTVAAGTVEQAEHSELHEHLQLAMERLRAIEKRTLELRLDGYKYSQIARDIKCCLPTVRKAEIDALRKLRRFGIHGPLGSYARDEPGASLPELGD